MEKDKKEKESLSKKFFVILFVVCIVVVVFLGVGIYFYLNRKPEVVNKTENGGKVVLNYATNVNGLSLNNLVPITDAQGMSTTDSKNYYDFSVDVDLDNASIIEYEISVDKVVKNSTISDDDIRLYLEKENSGSYSKVSEATKYIPLKKDSELGSSKGSMILTTSQAKKSGTDNYRLRMWLSNTSLLPTGSYSVLVKVVGKAK